MENGIVGILIPLKGMIQKIKEVVMLGREIFSILIVALHAKLWVNATTEADGKERVGK